jgi:hypothetical protein
VIAAAGSVYAQVNTNVYIASLAIVGNTLTITGQNFGASTPTVQVAGGTAVVSSSSDTEIVAETSALAPGTHVVKVTRDTNAGGTATSTLRIR